MKITEQNVVQQIQKKNERAISFIIQQYGGLLAAIIKRRLNDNLQDYEECLDDVLLSIWNHADSFDPKKNSFKQWIAAIAKYRAIDYQRKLITMQNQQYSVPDMDESMVKTMQPSETDGIEELLAQLPERERKIFEKYYLEGTPSSEIANEFDVKESWIYNKLSRGRKKLRNFYFEKMKYEE